MLLPSEADRAHLLSVKALLVPVRLETDSSETGLSLLLLPLLYRREGEATRVKRGSPQKWRPYF